MQGGRLLPVAPVGVGARMLPGGMIGVVFGDVVGLVFGEVDGDVVGDVGGVVQVGPSGTYWPTVSVITWSLA